MDTAITVRTAAIADLAWITDIYNEAVKNTTATFDTEPRSELEQLAWFNSHSGRHPILVAIIDGKVAGWAAINRWSDRKAYDGTGGVSFYVRSDLRGRGVGRRLAEAIVAEARRLQYHTLIARVASESSVSLHLSRSIGFVDIGLMKEVGMKFGRLLDVHILQMMLDQSSRKSTEKTH
jgi:L-amino acid N-acyltransferase